MTDLVTFKKDTIPKAARIHKCALYFNESPVTHDGPRYFKKDTIPKAARIHKCALYFNVSPVTHDGSRYFKKDTIPKAARIHKCALYFNESPVTHDGPRYFKKDTIPKAARIHKCALYFNESPVTHDGPRYFKRIRSLRRPGYINVLCISMRAPSLMTDPVTLKKDTIPKAARIHKCALYFNVSPVTHDGSRYFKRIRSLRRPGYINVLFVFQ
ncbi:hypothetical protein CEXT_516601 [Caerostris extrusa]|uniref:Uncharacterized protein n=1 Tax=Caerostris extrusa TaxID=172846 RepID=A0AAV4PQP7_CAEEX|nr:hypothetical protein CEXT_516601 [Caerostris extrusa]